MLKFGFTMFSGVGNAVLSTPMLKALRSMYPDAEINVFTWNRCVEVFKGLSFIDNVYTCNSFNTFSLDYLLVSPLCGCPEALSVQAKNVIEIKKNGWGKHESEYNMDLVRKLGYNGITPTPEIFSPNKAPQEKYVVMSLGFVDGIEWHLKQIKNNNEWINVCHHLIQENYRIFFLGTQKDYEIAQNIIPQLPEGKAVNACGLTSLKQAIAIVENASMFVGLDCGLAHIASCFQIPSVIAWTFTNRTKNTPLNPNLEIIEVECKKRPDCQFGSWRECKAKPCRDLTAEMIIAGIKRLNL